MQTQAEKLLLQYFGYTSFRPGQLDMIESLVSGQDALAIMPTGAGKSICYQIPALMLDGITLVISPLISLMKDQVNTLNSIGIRAAYLNSSLNPRQYAKALDLARQYTYKIIYVAPERLLTDSFVSFCKSVRISLVAVDESHCVSQWGQNFRPSYTDIPKFMEIFDQRPVMAALTATATPLVRKDILTLTGLKNPKETVTGYDRPNLYFEVQQPKDKYAALIKALRRFDQQTGIIYCLTRKQTDELYENLRQAGYPVTKYHAGMDATSRQKAQEDFLYDRANIICATSAFGMGIDKSNVRFVIHYSMPSSLESYYQEAGRAGRDGLDSSCILFYHPQDFHTCKFFLDHAEVNPNLTCDQQESAAKMDWIRLCKMKDYCFYQGCLRSYILSYFGEKASDHCNNCSNCLSDWQEEDVTRECQIIAECILALPRSYGVGMIRDVLRGSGNAKIKNANLHSNPMYGKLKNYPSELVTEMIEQMIMQNILVRSLDFYQTISAGEEFSSLVQDERTVSLRHKTKKLSSITQEKKADGSSGSKIMDQQAKDLMDYLRMVRREIAMDNHVPPYIIFNDKTLRELALKKPEELNDLLDISGIGLAKLEKYGPRFLQAIREFLQKQENS